MGGMEMASEARLDASGTTIKIIKARNGTIIEYSSPYEGESASAIGQAAPIKPRGGRGLYVVPEGTPLPQAILAVIALMKLE